MSQVSHFNNEITKIMGMRAKNQSFSENKTATEKTYTAFNEAFKSLSRLQKCNLDSFIESNSYFSKTREEISSLYFALKEPDKFYHIIDSFGLSAKRMKIASKGSPIKSKEKEGILVLIITYSYSTKTLYNNC